MTTRSQHESHYEPEGKTSMTLMTELKMTDPLVTFDWPNLHVDYDRLCKKFSPSAPFLESFTPRPESDRDLYYSLVERFNCEVNTPGGLTVESYEGMLYWKLYSQPAAIANTCTPLREVRSLREEVSRSLGILSEQLRGSKNSICPNTTDYVRDMGKYNLWGMRSSTALPVRTTFLHFVDPSTVPIFDKQVLLAVGVYEKRSNEKTKILDVYLPHARMLASRYSNHFSIFKRETPIRLIDMALWVVRGGC